LMQSPPIPKFGVRQVLCRIGCLLWGNATQFSSVGSEFIHDMPMKTTSTPLLGITLCAMLALLVTSAATQAQITVLTTFDYTNGANPNASLTLSGSTLYGTTSYGGANGVGEVFSLPVGGGTPTILTSFDNTHGAYPYGSLTLIGSTLYGTTSEGGANGKGTVFSLPVAGGTPTVLASFDNTNGAYPNASLTLSGSTFYGTTTNGGANGKGTVFSLPVGGGTPTILATFDDSHGANPDGSLTLIGSTLYGTTTSGGANGSGTVFSLPVGGGTPTLLASFDYANGAGAAFPVGSLTLGGSTFYGTLRTGGPNEGAGAVFSLPVAGGTPTILTTFDNADPTKGAYPWGSLTLIGNTLYGTTSSGGPNNGAGTVFSVPVSGGTPTVLASFDGTNGDTPYGDLTLSSDGSTFYGTTAGGGPSGNGVVFSVPAPAPEPGSAALLATGILATVARRRRRTAI
jgi:uncharacterized repeat protein (TIGR03803 family)